MCIGFLNIKDDHNRKKNPQTDYSFDQEMKRLMDKMFNIVELVGNIISFSRTVWDERVGQSYVFLLKRLTRWATHSVSYSRKLSSSEVR